MTHRSQIHMLTVAVARLEQERANPQLVSDLNKLLKVHVARVLEGGKIDVEEERRIGRQRTLMAMLPDTRSVDALKDEMLQRAYDLLWAGHTEGCDTLLEFLPSAAVEKMLDAWSNDQDHGASKSKWYSR